jgi:hypothetical protein
MLSRPLTTTNLSDLKQHLKQMLLEWREKQYAADKMLVAGDDTIRLCLASPNYNNPES